MAHFALQGPRPQCEEATEHKRPDPLTRHRSLPRRCTTPKRVWGKVQNRQVMNMCSNLYQSLMSIHSFSSCLKTGTKNESPVETNLISSLLSTPIQIPKKVTMSVREQWRPAFCLGAALLCLWHSTEPLPGMAHDDNDFALYTGHCLRAKPLVSLWVRVRCKQGQVWKECWELRSRMETVVTPRPRLTPLCSEGKEEWHRARGAYTRTPHTGTPLILCGEGYQHPLDLPRDKPAFYE